ncbi:uncharacterized protein LOC135830675 [Sycon ciliatum]|uniref:uncharacterized protein LOC135830675 n=1 Tax=Sycon ciliatum TaxID=27933 RepID=UPI0031F5F64D
MDRAHKDILRTQSLEIRRSLTVDDDVLLELRSRRILSNTDIIRIQLNITYRRNEMDTETRTQTEQADILLDILPSRGSTAFSSFHDALRDSTLTSNNDLASMLRQEEREKRVGRHLTCFPLADSLPGTTSNPHSSKPSRRIIFDIYTSGYAETTMVDTALDWAFGAQQATADGDSVGYLGAGAENLSEGTAVRRRNQAGHVTEDVHIVLPGRPQPDILGNRIRFAVALVCFAAVFDLLYYYVL